MRLLGISGSLRQSSLNTHLVRLAGQCHAVSAFRLADLRLPLFDEDLETSGDLAPSVVQLVVDITWSDGVLFATPEYNKNMSGALKNALDWISRQNSRPLRDKPVAICSVAAGRGGGLQAQYSLRHCLTPFCPAILQGPELAISAEGPPSSLETERNRERLSRLLTALANRFDNRHVRLET